MNHRDEQTTLFYFLNRFDYTKPIEEITMEVGYDQ